MNTQKAPDPIEAELVAVAKDCRALALRLAVLTAASTDTSQAPVRPLASAQVRRYLRARRLRETILPAELFADPAWDMLLDLYASELEDRAVSVSSACIASAVPPTTALRWLGRLEELGLIERLHDERDNRRTLVTLTGKSRIAIERWLEQAPWLGLDQASWGTNQLRGAKVDPPHSARAGDDSQIRV